MSGRQRFGFAAVVMNLWAYPAMAAWTLGGIIVFPLLFVIWKAATGWSPHRIMRHLVWIYGKVWIALMSPFVRFRIEGACGRRDWTPAVIVVNHYSFFDTYFMGGLPFFDVAFAVRSWPFKMFWYRYFMRLAGYLDVESLGWEEILRRAQAVFAEGAGIIFFPEGHRSRDGALHRFYSGAFKLAVATGVPVLPLCITGTDALLPPGRWWLHPAKVVLRALPAVSPVSFTGPLAHHDLRRAVKAAMAEYVHG